MDRVSAANYQTFSGKRFFVDPDLGTATQGTGLGAVWHDGVQESIVEVIEASGQTPADSAIGSPDPQLLQAIMSLPGKNVQVFSVSGTFTVPANVTALEVELWAAGAGSFASVSGLPSGGSGSGGYAKKLITGLAPGAVITVTIGAGGTAGATGVAPGAGGVTSFGAYASATGGAFNPLNTLSVPTLGGSGGVGSGGDENLHGGDGGNGDSGLFFGGWGGGAARGSGQLVVASGPGVAGRLPGGGASGAGTGGGGTTAQNGAAGASGFLIVRW